MPLLQAQWTRRLPAGSGRGFAHGRGTGVPGRFQAVDAPALPVALLGARAPDSAGLQLPTQENSTPHPRRALEQAAPAEIPHIACVSVLHPDTPRVVFAGRLARRRHWRAWQPLSRSDGRCVRDGGIPKAKAVARGTMRSHTRDRFLPTKGIATGLPASMTRAFYHGEPGWRTYRRLSIRSEVHGNNG